MHLGAGNHPHHYHSGRLCPGLDGVPRPPGAVGDDPDRHAGTEYRAGAAHLPRAQCGQADRQSVAAILPFSFFPFGVYLTYIYSSTAVSRDLLDAARIDGVSEVQVFARIAMPLATPVIALVGFFNFTGNWNNYFLPYVMLPGRKAPIQVGLAELLSNVPSFNPTNAASTTISLSALALATLIAIAPVMIVFVFAQRYLVSGMTAGGTKE